MEPGNKARLASLLFVGILPLGVNGFYNSHIAAMPRIYWTAEILTWLVLPSLLFWIAGHKGRIRPSDVGLHRNLLGRSRWPAFLGATLTLSLLVLALDVYFVAVARQLWPVNHGALDFSYGEVLPASGFPRVLVLLHLCGSAGIVEELYFRGLPRLLFPPTGAGSFWYIVITATAFSSIHWEGGMWSLTVALLFGLATATLYVLTGNLWPLMIGHALADAWWFA